MTAEQALRAMLPRLDAAIEREVLRLRGRYQLSLDEFRGLYVSDAQVDALLMSAGIDPRHGHELPPIELPGRWRDLIAAFELDPVEADLLLLALAPELDARYPALFAYLNDDAARRRPTPDLAMRLFGDGWEGREAVRLRLAPHARLANARLIGLEPDGSAGYRLAPLVACHLLGGDAVAAAMLRSIAPAGDGDCAELAQLLAASQPAPIVLLAGREGTGRRAFAAQVAARMERPLVELDGMRLGQGTEALDDAILAARLTGAALLVGAETVAPDAIAARLGGCPVPVFVAVGDASPWERAVARWPHLTRRFAVLAYGERRAIWRDALRGEGLRASPAAVDAVAGRFRLSEGAVRRAARDARIALLRPPGSAATIPPAAMMDVARRQCTLDLGHLASLVDARPGWEDLVLPGGVLDQLRNLADAAAERDRVYDGWGMGDVGRAAGRGVAALFSGASGTGKTMSAAVIARATGLDLWRIDLSSVVSKYIGETEKNLERIFTGARDGDAILLFDEADALFGKRSEVRDAHDRYANVEVAYLLQRLEEFDGIAILASNFSRNIDQAFVRRLHYIVEFPLPDARLRERLWRKAFSRRTPIQDRIDYGLLGRQFTLAGGDIRSAALDAAFLAASDGGVITMPHILRAVTRQMLKQGRLPSRSDGAGWRPVNGHAAADAESAP